ncbi:HAD family hydrolase [Rudanella lutea]|uniref:HAD family hydrolase n=1 Tax=Rudanella lutea TaxID=451374 RepID=UPI0003641739|nr:HAD family hydrolase [Rudanella lutea]
MMVSNGLLGEYEVILFDLMDTLMFGGNRFSADEDYAYTYAQLGGHLYSDEFVQSLIQAVYERMRADYNHPGCYTNFPAASVYIRQLLTEQQASAADADRLAQVFALHELGHIPDGHVATLDALSQTHRLGLVSNLWAGADLFRRVFREVGIHHLFEVLVFSSDHACIKPSPRLFRVALDQLAVEPRRILFVGDDADRDVAAARALGMGTVWVTEAEQEPGPGRCIRSVVELVR